MKCLTQDSGFQDNIPNRKVPNAKYACCSVPSLLVTEVVNDELEGMWAEVAVAYL
jgi:hypothetical protein